MPENEEFPPRLALVGVGVGVAELRRRAGNTALNADPRADLLGHLRWAPAHLSPFKLLPSTGNWQWHKYGDLKLSLRRAGECCERS